MGTANNDTLWISVVQDNDKSILIDLKSITVSRPTKNCDIIATYYQEVQDK